MYLLDHINVNFFKISEKIHDSKKLIQFRILLIAEGIFKILNYSIHKKNQPLNINSHCS